MGQQILMDQVYTDEWCQTMESVLVDLAEVISSINEPRLMTKDDSLKIESLREQIHYLHCTLDHG
ncbi:MAG: hypothetical protein ACYDBT_07770 [Desulfobulbaceae bacterium]